MNRDLLVARIKHHAHRVRMWNLYKDLVKRYPNKYRLDYDTNTLSFKLLMKNKFGQWKIWCESQGWFGNG